MIDDNKEYQRGWNDRSNGRDCDGIHTAYFQGWHDAASFAHEHYQRGWKDAVAAVKAALEERFGKEQAS